MKGGEKEDGRPVVMKEAFAGRRARAVGVKARKVRHLSLGEKKRIHGRAADEFLQARRITSASMSSQHGRASIGRTQARATFT